MAERLHQLAGCRRAVSIPAASTSEQGIVELATAGEVATGTDPARVPSVAAMGNHQGVAKAWVNFSGTGTVAIRSSYNVSSISDGGVGTYGVNFATPMANANYAAAGNCSNTGGAKSVTFPPTNTFGRTVSTLGVDVFTSAAALIDADHINVIVFGG